MIADTPSLPRRELQEALALAAQLGFNVRVVKTQEFANPSYVANPPERCYYCKRELFGVLGRIAEAEAYSAILYGENADDANDFRPGSRAAAEFGARAPLKEVGLSKAEIRALSAELGLPTAQKPQMACLSSRVPYGEVITHEKLTMIESAETVLRDLGFCDVRVRHHQLGASHESVHSSRMVPGQSNPKAEPIAKSAFLARIEVGRAELQKLMADGVMDRIVAAFRRLGYEYVTLDLEGYRPGRLNDALGNPALPGSGPPAR